MRLPLRLVLAALLAVLLAGCGFHLRGTASGQLPYKSIYLALPQEGDIAIWLQRYIRASGGTEIAAGPEGAEAILQQIDDRRDKTILSVNAQGRVREYRLIRNYTFRVVNAKGQILVPPNEINLIRDITYNDSAVLAKDLEEATLWRDMNTDLVNQIMRRLSLVKPRNPDLEEDDR